MMLIDAKRTGDGKTTNDPVDYAERLGLPPFIGVLSWNIFDAVLTPGDYVVMLTWQDSAAAQTFEDSTASLLDGIRFRRIRIVRDYGMYDRREAPQYYPDAPGRATIHS